MGHLNTVWWKCLLLEHHICRWVFGLPATPQKSRTCTNLRALSKNDEWHLAEYTDPDFCDLLKFWQSLPQNTTCEILFLPLKLLGWRIYAQVLFLGISVQSVDSFLGGYYNRLVFLNWVMQVGFQVSEQITNMLPSSSFSKLSFAWP